MTRGSYPKAKISIRTPNAELKDDGTIYALENIEEDELVIVGFSPMAKTEVRR